jgi:hypothetical protein
MDSDAEIENHERVRTDFTWTAKDC